MSDFAYLFTILLPVLIAFMVIRIVPEQGRYAVFKDEDFVTLKGPGLLCKLPWQSQNWVRIHVGDSAQIIDQSLAAIKGVNIPIQLSRDTSPGVNMHVLGFRDSIVLVGVV